MEVGKAAAFTMALKIGTYTIKVCKWLLKYVGENAMKNISKRH